VVRVSIEVRSVAARFRVAVRARSIQRALSLVGGSYPASDLRVIFPLDPNGFFVRDAAAQAGSITFEEPQKSSAA
jgi:hypothetical protein